MRQDKLTTKFQEALGEAQSLALAHDNQVIEPVHILAAVLADGEGSSRSLLERAGVNVQSLTREVNAAVERLPKVSGTGGDVQISRDLMNLLNLTEKEAMKRGDEFISTEMLLLALTEDRSEAGRLAKNAGLTRAAIEAAVDLLDHGGVLLVAVYPGHAEGEAEGKMVLDYFATLDRHVICCTLIKIVNSPTSPFFIVVEKK